MTNLCKITQNNQIHVHGNERCSTVILKIRKTSLSAGLSIINCSFIQSLIWTAEFCETFLNNAELLLSPPSNVSHTRGKKKQFLIL